MLTHPDTSTLAKLLWRAIRREKPVTITYTKRDGSITVRTVEPFEMSRSKANIPLLHAMDRDTGKPRTFRIREITAVTIHNRGQRRVPS